MKLIREILTIVLSISSALIIAQTPTHSSDVNITGNLEIIKDGNIAFLNGYSYRNTSGGLGILGYAARGTELSPLALSASDNTLWLRGMGFDGGVYHRVAHINFRPESVSSGSVPGYLSFETNAGGGTHNLIERLRISSNGYVGIGTTTPTQQLHITKKLRLNWNDSNTASNDDSPTIYTSGQGASYPFSGRGNLILQTRATNSNGFGDLVVMTGQTATPKFIVRAGGNVGIGYNSPNAQLVVGNAFGASISGSGGGNAVFGTNIAIQHGGSNHNQLFTPHSHTGNYGYAGVHARWGTLRFYTAAQNTSSNEMVTPEARMFIGPDGDVGIGTTTPQSKLAVDGQIRATEVKVLANVNDVPDYVFESDYKLRTLQETKEYIAENKHLPEIPSAAEIGENGIDLGDMNMRLLKKIEELTLYQIELMEEMQEMKEELEALKD